VEVPFRRSSHSQKGVAGVKGTGGGGGEGGEGDGGGVGGLRAFQLLTEKDMLCVGSEEHLTTLLGCAATARVKVVSIYGNTGDGMCNVV
jgi:hypothetical protein